MSLIALSFFCVRAHATSEQAQEKATFFGETVRTTLPCGPSGLLGSSPERPHQPHCGSAWLNINSFMMTFSVCFALSFFWGLNVNKVHDSCDGPVDPQRCFSSGDQGCGKPETARECACHKDLDALVNHCMRWWKEPLEDFGSPLLQLYHRGILLSDITTRLDVLCQQLDVLPGSKLVLVYSVQGGVQAAFRAVAAALAAEAARIDAAKMPIDVDAADADVAEAQKAV